MKNYKNLCLLLCIIMLLSTFPISMPVMAEPLTGDERPAMVIDPAESGITDGNGYLFYEDFDYYTGANSVTVSKNQYPSPLSQSGGMLAGSEYLQPTEFNTGGWPGGTGSVNSEVYGNDPTLADGRVSVGANSRIALWFYDGNFGGDKTTTSQDGYMNKSLPWNARYRTAFEFDVEASGNGDFSIRLTAPNNRDKRVTTIAVNKNTNNFSPSNDNTPTNVISEYGKSVPAKMNVTIVADCKGTDTNSTYSVYLDGILVAEDYKFNSSIGAGINIGRLYIQVNGNTTIFVDNLKVYRVETEESTPPPPPPPPSFEKDERPLVVIDSADSEITDENGYLFYEDFDYYTGADSVLVSKTNYPSPLSQSGGMLSGSQYLQPVEYNTGGWPNGTGSTNSEEYGSDPTVSGGRVSVGANSRIALWFYDGDFSGNKTTITPGNYMNKNIPWNPTYRTAFEFDVETSGNGDFSIRLTPANNRDNRVTTIAVHKNNNIFSPYDNNDASINVISKLGEPVPARMNVMIVADYQGNAARSTYNVYLNGVLVAKEYKFNSGYGTDIGRLYIQANSNTNIWVDNVKVYRVGDDIIPDEERIQLDYTWLSESSLVNEDDIAYLYGMISKNLNLPATGKYKSDISWSSSNESLISSQGIVNYAENASETVTLMAKISRGEHSITKEFTFKVIEAASGDNAAQKDAAIINYNTVALYDGGTSEIKQSLNISDSAVYGSTVSWSSSNTRYITNSGRVTRPRFYEENENVTMTAVISSGSTTITKTFEFIVLKDEEWTDMGYMTDAEFFGVWDGSTWKTAGKFNYDFLGLESVRDAAKEGNYTLAKECLQNYYAKRVPQTSISISTRRTIWANAMADDFYSLASAAYFLGDFTVGNAWRASESNLSAEYITPGEITCFGVRAWYNEASYAEIRRHNDPNMLYRPKIELTVNGSIRTYYAVDSIGVRAGQYKTTNYSDADTMRVQTFGDFLGNDTRHAVIKFDFSDLKSSDKITEAKLIVHAKAAPAFSGLKRMIVLKDPTNIWNSETAAWNDFPGFVYSYNGLPDKNDWLTNPLGADNEFWWQQTRLAGHGGALPTEYLATGDDTYLYKQLSIINDFLIDSGTFKMSSTSAYNPNGLRGGFTRSLDAAIRNNALLALIEVVAKSEITPPGLFTAMMKNIWDTANFLSVYNTREGNWRQTEFQSILNASAKVPEFYDSLAGKNWRKMGQDELESAMFLNHLEDGSYVEATGQYNISMFNMLANYKRDMQIQGLSVSPEYDDLLHKSAYYNLLMYTPNGMDILYGDSDLAPLRTPGNYENVAKWNNDKELEFIATYGQSGIEPSWTSKHWPLSTVTAMRANWTNNSPYLFTNVRGGGAHGHSDFNHVTVYAYGRTLLNDAGRFVYEDSDPGRIFGVSTAAHNSVVIDDKSQVHIWAIGKNATGTIFDWTTNASFDYLSQSTPSNPGSEHRRSITFIKQPAMWIVSDLMTPTDGDLHNYKQTWHMPPDAGLAVSQGDKTIYSNYSSGANVIVANADGTNAELKTEDGLYSPSYGTSQDAPYAYFEKTSTGTETFDTVLIPSNNDPAATATAEKLTTTANAVALKINYKQNGNENVGYYYMSYDNQSGTFGKYSTDGEVAFASENANGSVTYYMIKNGTYIKNDTTGKYLLKSETILDEFALDMMGANIYVTSGTATDVSKAVTDIGAGKIVSRVYLNKSSVSYTLLNDVLSNIGSGTISGGDDDIKAPTGGIENMSKGNAGGTGTGGTGGGTPVNPDIPNPGSFTSFPDVMGHWSATYANDLKKENILTGDENGNFNPDNNVTRAEFTAMIVRALRLDKIGYSGSFEDVKKDDWYADIIETALLSKLISPDEIFRPDDNITRQEMAKIISIAAQISEKFDDVEMKFSSFTDGADISEWAREYVDYAYSIGLINGMADGSFKPLNNATRGEAAAVIKRLLIGE